MSLRKFSLATHGTVSRTAGSVPKDISSEIHAFNIVGESVFKGSRGPSTHG
ncbi:MAG: hypothetical protein QXO01_00995 [Nitrososphaerota archaeon]